MSDIIKRLRDEAVAARDWSTARVFETAADEIERLRAEVENLKQVARRWIDAYDRDVK